MRSVVAGMLGGLAIGLSVGPLFTSLRVGTLSCPTFLPADVCEANRVMFSVSALGFVAGVVLAVVAVVLSRRAANG